MVDEGCSIMIEDIDLTPEKLYQELSQLIKDSEKVKLLQEASLNHVMYDATEKIVENIIAD